MAKSKTKNSTPADMTIEEASEFWDEHSLFEFAGTEEVEVEFNLRKKRYVGINDELFQKLQAKASQKKMSAEALLNAWILEKTQSTL